ncbi:unnamed protein product [Leuciscus chuanchicus]
MFVPQEKWCIETKGEREPSVLPPAASQPWHDVEKKSLTRHGATLGGRLDTCTWSISQNPHQPHPSISHAARELTQM